MAKTYFARDDEMLAQMDEKKCAEFEAWMTKLDEAHEKAGSPYGKGTLWEITGAECWKMYFDDTAYRDDPGGALQEDLSADDFG